MAVDQPIERCCFRISYQNSQGTTIERSCEEEAWVSIISEDATPDLITYACGNHVYHMLEPGTSAVTMLK